MEKGELFLEKLSQISNPKIIEKNTRHQALSDTWFEQREGRITASNHHDIYTKVNTILRAKKVQKTTPLVAKVLGRKKDLSAVPSLKWGREKEDEAKAKFLLQQSINASTAKY